MTESIDRLIAALADSNDDVAWAAAHTLVEIGEPSVLPLIEALGGKKRRGMAAWTLGHIDDRRSVEPLLATLEDYWDSNERGPILVGLAGAGDMRALEPFMRLMHAGSRLTLDEEDTIISGLMKIGEPAIDRLVSALKDDDPVLRRRAQRALGQLEDDRAVQFSIALLADPIDKIRGHAALRLGSLGDSQAVEPLIGALHDPSEKVRSFAAISLSKLADGRAVESLIELLYDESSIVRRAVLGALGSIGNPQAIQPVVNLLLDEEEMFRGLSAGASVLPVLSVLKSEDNRGVRIEAVQCLARLGHLQALDELIAALDDADPEVLRRTAHILTSASGFQSVYSLVQDFNERPRTSRRGIVSLPASFDSVAIELTTLRTRATEDTRLRILAAVLQWTLERVKTTISA